MLWTFFGSVFGPSVVDVRARWTHAKNGGWDRSGLHGKWNFGKLKLLKRLLMFSISFNFFMLDFENLSFVTYYFILCLIIIKYSLLFLTFEPKFICRLVIVWNLTASSILVARIERGLILQSWNFNSEKHHVMEKDAAGDWSDEHRAINMVKQQCH